MDTLKATKNPKRKKDLLALFSLLRPYKVSVGVNIILVLTNMILGLMVPYSISKDINAFMRGRTSLNSIAIELGFIAIANFVFSSLQTFMQARMSARIAHDLRNRFIEKISEQEYASFQNITPGKLLSNLTTDIASIAQFISKGGLSFVSSILLIGVAGVFMFVINPKLSLMIFLIVLLVYGVSSLLIRRMRPLVEEIHSTNYKINGIINETILGAMLVRILGSRDIEKRKMADVATAAKDLSLRLAKIQANIPPSITLSANAAILIVIFFGGHAVINGSMGLGEFTAFNTYLAILIFPVSALGSVNSAAMQASTAYQRILEILHLKHRSASGNLLPSSRGDIVLSNVHVTYGKKTILKDISFSTKAGTRTAVVGPAGAGKTQLLYLLTGLVTSYGGRITYAGNDIRAYDPTALHRKFGLVFQDSIVFNLSLRENVAFNSDVKACDLELAIQTAELQNLIEALPEKLNTVIAERGTNLSGGQKQRLMLARALALKPTVLLLDDFTARLDVATEKKILKNVRANYPDMTVISVTQKIATIENYDQIILLMDGEVLAVGTHTELLRNSPEYVQIYESQRSTIDHAVLA